jgi:hypothetical protein
MSEIFEKFLKIYLKLDGDYESSIYLGLIRSILNIYTGHLSQFYIYKKNFTKKSHVFP